MITRRRSKERGHLFVVLLVAATSAASLVAGPAAAEPPREPDRAAASALEQLEAFRLGDFDAAYAFASQQIHELFDRTGFERMVRGGYPEIADSVSAVVEHGALGPNGNAYVFLLVRGANGRAIEAIYEMVWEDGRWKVNAVVARPARTA